MSPPPQPSMPVIFSFKIKLKFLYMTKIAKNASLFWTVLLGLKLKKKLLTCLLREKTSDYPGILKDVSRDRSADIKRNITFPDYEELQVSL